MTDGTTETAIEIDPLGVARINQIEADLKVWANKPIEFSFDPQGTDLFSMMELAYSYARRCVDFAGVIRALVALERVVPATIVARALMETVAMGCLYLHEMSRLIALGERDRVEAKLVRFYAGSRGHENEPIHVMDAIRFLEKIDGEYLSYLDAKYGLSKKLDKVIPQGKTISDALSVKKTYGELSEITHPNGLGTQFLYCCIQNIPGF